MRGFPSLAKNSETSGGSLAAAPGSQRPLAAGGWSIFGLKDLLAEWEIPRALVHGGFSSVLALEPPPDREGWPLTLSAPGPGPREVLARLSARQRAFSASGTRKGAHIVNPQSGLPVEGGASWVALDRPVLRDEEVEWPDAARSPAAVAEGLSTAFMILPEGDVESLCGQWPGLEAWLLRQTGPGAGAAALRHVSGRTE